MGGASLSINPVFYSIMSLLRSSSLNDSLKKKKNQGKKLLNGSCLMKPTGGTFMKVTSSARLSYWQMTYSISSHFKGVWCGLLLVLHRTCCQLTWLISFACCYYSKDRLLWTVAMAFEQTFVPALQIIGQVKLLRLSPPWLRHGCELDSY